MLSKQNVLTAHQEELLERFDAESASYVYEDMGWTWSSLGSPPSPLVIRQCLTDLMFSAHRAALESPAKESSASTGRLRVTADLTDSKKPWYRLSFEPIAIDSECTDSYYEEEKPVSNKEEARLRELQNQASLTPGEQREVDYLLEKKYQPKPELRKGGLSDLD